MTATARPRRSVLYMPGANVRALEKARGLPADGLILDLEDAVAPDQKLQACENVRVALSQGGYGNREIFVRINALDTAWGHADAVFAATSGADAVLVPKIEGAAQVRQVAGILEQAGAPATQRLWVMMETPLAILRAEEIASAHPRLAGFVMGTNDLVKDLRAAHTPLREPLVTSLGLSLLAARAYGLAILDGVYNDLDDAQGFDASLLSAKLLGFDGKTLIHPKQVARANEVFAPTAAELEAARKIIAGFEEARREGKGVVVVDGKMVENLHVVRARQQVELAEAIAALG